METLSNFKMGLTVTAISRQGDTFQSVCVRRKARMFELLSMDGNQEHKTWRSQGTSAGVLDASYKRKRTAHHNVVLGVNSVGVMFNKLTLPKVGMPETQAMVRMQTETRLPLGADQTAMDWKTVFESDAQRIVTVAALRRNSGTLNDMASLEPDRILLESQALVQIWQWGFMGDTKDGLLMSCHDHHTVLCCVKSGQLLHASVLDFGVSDLSDAATARDMAGQFAEDVGLAMQVCSETVSACHSVTVMSDGSESMQAVMQVLMLHGLEVHECIPNTAAFTHKDGVQASDVYAYRVPIGLALCQLDDELDGFELLKDLCGAKVQKQSSYTRVIAAGAAAVAAIVLMIGVCYGMDLKRHQILSDLTNTPEVAAFKRDKAFQKQVASQRVDLIDVLDTMTSKSYEGVTLDTFSFKRGQPLELKGRADKTDKWYAYEEAISNLNGVKEFKRDDPITDEKDKKIKFSLNFHYKTYTQKAK